MRAYHLLVGKLLLLFYEFSNSPKIVKLIFIPRGEWLNEHHGSTGWPQKGLQEGVALQVSAPTRHLAQRPPPECTPEGGLAPASFIKGPGEGAMAPGGAQRLLAGAASPYFTHLSANLMYCSQSQAVMPWGPVRTW